MGVPMSTHQEDSSFRELHVAEVQVLPEERLQVHLLVCAPPSNTAMGEVCRAMDKYMSSIPKHVPSAKKQTWVDEKVREALKGQPSALMAYHGIGERTPEERGPHMKFMILNSLAIRDYATFFPPSEVSPTPPADSPVGIMCQAMEAAGGAVPLDLQPSAIQGWMDDWVTKKLEKKPAAYKLYEVTKSLPPNEKTPWLVKQAKEAGAERACMAWIPQNPK